MRNCIDIKRLMADHCWLSAQARVRRIAEALADVFPEDTLPQRITASMRLVSQQTGIEEIKARINNNYRIYKV